MLKDTNIKLLILDVDGTLTDGGIYITEKGDSFKKFNAKDGTAIRYLLKNGIEVGIISASISQEIVRTRAKMLGMKYCYVGDDDKALVLDKWLNDLNITSSQVAFVGDDVNDLTIIKKVGLSACPIDAVDIVKKNVTHILTKTGGEACVREFVEKYLGTIS
jgi:3-deoxy-D-manno-octulosonate 8-phosphate phosphatase (KDO 8-P phosphatase)